MGLSPSHKFGQIIGDVLEEAIEPLLRGFAQDHGLYLDRKGPRTARKGKSVSWTDASGNKHDLDFVLEKGGTDSEIGTPVAFIETAWRRYTKHSRNKAQEIQGAILPLVTTHRHVAPFIGVILAGVFTEGALAQLRSLGFTAIYFPYETVIQAFRCAGIDASFHEKTPDSAFAKKVRAWKRLPRRTQAAVPRSLLELNSGEVRAFMGDLKLAITRKVETVRILPLHGTPREMSSVQDAIAFIQTYDEGASSQPIVKYEVAVRYSNGDRIEAQFTDKGGAVQFLRGLPVPPAG